MVVISLIACVVLALADQIIKYFVNMYLKPVGSVTVIDNLLTFTYHENDGAAFGLFSQMRWLFILLTVLLMLFLLYLLISKKINSKLFYVSATLIIGGGIGNLIDRLFLGYVIDYIQLSFFPPVCNFADYCVTFGTVLLIIYILFFSDFLKDSKKIKKDAGND